MMKLEIGPGTNPSEGYDTLDAFSFYDKPPTYCFDITKEHVWPIEDNKYDEVLAIHVLEHVNLDSLYNIFKNVNRILKPLGLFRVHVPNGPVIADAYLTFPEKRYLVYDGGTSNRAIYGSESEEPGKQAFAHKILFDPELLISAFQHSNFISTENVTMKYKDIHDNYWSWMCDEETNRFSLKVQGLKA